MPRQQALLCGLFEPRLLINLGAPLINDGITRVVNGLDR